MHASSNNDPSKSADRGSPDLPEVMRAGVRTSYGDSSVLGEVETRTPTVRPDTVLVKVKSAALNPLDWHMTTGTPWLVRLQAGVRRPKKQIVGVDFAGIVVAVGSEVTVFEPGDQVSGVAPGAFAEYVAATPDRLVPKPGEVTYDAAAGMGVAGVTALQGLRDKAQVKPGDRVLINGASGGVGTAAVQLAKWMGAHVTAVSSTQNVELVRSLGADDVVDYTKADFTNTNERYDLLFDNQGNHSLSASRRILTKKGVYLLVGGPKANRVFGPVGRMLRALIRFQFASQRAMAFVADERKEDLTILADLMASGELRTIVDTKYQLSEISTAMEHLGKGHVRGKLIVKP